MNMCAHKLSRWFLFIAVLLGKAETVCACVPPPGIGVCVEPSAATWHDQIQFFFPSWASFAKGRKPDQLELLVDGLPAPNCRLLWIDTQRGIASYQIEPPPPESALQRQALAAIRPGRLSRLIHFSFLWADGDGSTLPVDFAIISVEPLCFWLIVGTIVGIGALLVWAGWKTNLVRCRNGGSTRFSLARSQAALSLWVSSACLLWTNIVFPSDGTLGHNELALCVFGIGMLTALCAVYLDASRIKKREALLAGYRERLRENGARIHFLQDAISRLTLGIPERNRFEQELLTRQQAQHALEQEIDDAGNRQRAPQYWFLHEIVTDANGVCVHRVQFVAVSLVLGSRPPPHIGPACRRRR
jgi:hypothetical protein